MEDIFGIVITLLAIGVGAAIILLAALIAGDDE